MPPKEASAEPPEIWEVVGGGDKGGILVRDEQDISSPQCAERLSTGALVKKVVLEGERMHYERLTGVGPFTGWVSIKLKDKDLLVKTDKTPPVDVSILESSKIGDRTVFGPGTGPVIRWAVNIDLWTPQGDHEGDEFKYLLSLIPEEDEQNAVLKYRKYDDKKRALMSRLLMRAASASVLGLSSFKDISVARTKGKKPFLASPLVPVDKAPNFNINVSHEGPWVVASSEPMCVTGIDVAELRRHNPKGKVIDFHKNFKDQLAVNEWLDVKAAGSSLDDQYEVFSRFWSAKEAFTKARGDGVAFPLGDAEFKWIPVPDAPTNTAFTGTVKVKGEAKPLWKLYQNKLPGNKSNWVTVARGPLTDIVDAKGEFTQTLRKKQDSFSAEEWKTELNKPSPDFDIIPVAALVPSDAMDDFVKAGGTPLSGS